MRRLLLWLGLIKPTSIDRLAKVLKAKDEAMKLGLQPPFRLMVPVSWKGELASLCDKERPQLGFLGDRIRELDGIQEVWIDSKLMDQVKLESLVAIYPKTYGKDQ